MFESGGSRECLYPQYDGAFENVRTIDVGTVSRCDPREDVTHRASRALGDRVGGTGESQRLDVPIVRHTHDESELFGQHVEVRSVAIT